MVLNSSAANSAFRNLMQAVISVGEIVVEIVVAEMVDAVHAETELN